MPSLFLLVLALSSATQSECFLSQVSTVSANHHHNSRQEAAPYRLFGSKEGFFDDDSSSPHEDMEDASFSGWLQGNRRRRRREEPPMSSLRRERLRREEFRESRFVSGDDLQHLRQQVLDLRHELQSAPLSRKRELEQTILQAQQVDAEFVYQVATERAEAAEFAGLHEEAAKYRQEATDARAALPQFNLEGLWVGKFNDRFQLINCTYQGDTLIATKVTGDKNVPKGELSFQVDLSPTGTQGIGPASSFGSSAGKGLQDRQEGGKDDEIFPSSDMEKAQEQPQPLEPIELNQEAAKQWGSRYLQRFQGMGQVASSGFRNAQWMDGQLILVGSSYFSFAWLPLGIQVFFGRPSAEMTLKLLRESQEKEEPLTRDREYLNRCWEETEHLEDDMEVSDGLFTTHDQQDYYEMEGCFE